MAILLLDMGFILPDKTLSLAAEEFRFLQERGYPRERSLTLVGNRRGLDSRSRNLLRRAILAPARAESRREKLLHLDDLDGSVLALDGHNVLITLESALTGKDLVRGDDGAIRDIAGAGSSYRPSDLTHRALGLILQALTLSGAARVEFYLDAPLSRSGELAGWIRREMTEAGLEGTASPLPVPETELKVHRGPVASSDGELIDHCPRPLDLAGLIIVERLEEAEIIDFAS